MEGNSGVYDEQKVMLGLKPDQATILVQDHASWDENLGSVQMNVSFGGWQGLKKVRLVVWDEELSLAGQLTFNPLSPKSGQHRISPCSIYAFNTAEWSWELQTWSHKMNLLDLLSISPHYFCRKWMGATMRIQVLILGFKELKLTCQMGRGLGKLSSGKFIN